MPTPPVCNLESMRFEFFAWAAARAAQAGSSKTTVAVLRDALVDADAIHWDKTIAVSSAKEYDAWHVAAIDGVHAKLIRAVPSISWGIAAKLVNVFIKGHWLLDAGCSGPMRFYGHPAIDSILLRLVDEKYKKYGCDYTRSLRWQRMTRDQYAGVIAFLRAHHQEAIWTIEEEWKAVR